MHQAIQTLYRDDPICGRQRQAVQPIALLTPKTEAGAWLSTATARIAELERQLGLIAE